MIKRSLGIITRIALAAICLAAAFKLSSATPHNLIFGNALGCAALVAGWVLNQIFCAWRLQILMRVLQIRIPYLVMLRITFSAFVAASVMPGLIAGDVAKVVLLKIDSRDVGLADLTLIALIDRALGMLCLWFLSVFLSFIIEVPDTGQARGLILIVQAGFFVLCAAAILVMHVLRRKREADIWWLPRMPARVSSFFRATIRLARDDRALAQIFLRATPISFVAVILLVSTQAGVGSLMMSELGEPQRILLQTFLAPTSIVVSSLPIAPSGIGVGQLTLATTYAIMQLPSEVAIALTSVVQISQILVAVVAAGLLALLPLGWQMPRGSASKVDSEQV